MRPDQLAELLESALKRAGEPEADAYARWSHRGFARFALGELGQHMSIEEPHAVLRVARGKRVAETSTTSLDEAGLVEAIRNAARMAPDVPEDGTFPGFTPPGEPRPAAVSRAAESTRRSTAEARVAALEPVLGAVERAGLYATGVLDATHGVHAVANTRGLRLSHAGTVALFKIWALESGGAGGAAGHGLAAHFDIDALDLMGETNRAIRDAQGGKDPIALEPGSYDVVLEAPAVSELAEWFGFIAIGAREVHQGTSPLSERLGQRISGELLTLTEDPLGELSFAVPFDRDGVARRRVPIIERGVARGVLYDRAWAARLGTESTGSASTPSALDDGGPAASALVVGGGDAASVDELVGGIERGLYVRRLHYVNGMLEPRRAVMTGLTRDGTFLIEHGRLTRAVGNMRFTDSLLEAFERADGLTRALQLLPNWWSDSGSVAAPAVRIRQLKFSGGSQRRG
jgi:PmbA protein